MVRTTGLRSSGHRSVATTRLAGAIAIVCLLGAASVALSGCSAKSDVAKEQTSVEVTGTPQGHGLAVNVQVTPEMMANKPKPWVLDTPENAVRSYLDWVSYAYRIGDSNVGIETMSGVQQVRVDSYIQFNLQEKGRLIDQKLDSITFGPASIEATHATISASEKWTYRHVSATQAGKELQAPKTASYDSKYTLVKTDKGFWVVDGISPKAK